MNSAPVGRPTRKGEAPLLAGYARRSAGRNMMIRSLPLLLIIGLCLPLQSEACSCVVSRDDEKQQISDAFENADLVFIGRIISSEMAPWIESGPHQELQKTRLQALRQWKGPKQKQFEFRIDVQCCVCGYEFPKSGDFLVYAYGPDEDGHFQTSICNRTRHLSQAADDIAVLDVLVKDANLPNKTMEPTR
jgi:hypothetical protein